MFLKNCCPFPLLEVSWSIKWQKMHVAKEIRIESAVWPVKQLGNEQWSTDCTHITLQIKCYFTLYD